MTSETLTVGPAALHELLADLLRTAGTDYTLPMLYGVLLQVEPKDDNASALVGTSTNRFVLGQASTDTNGRMQTTFLALDRVKQLLNILKPYSRSNDMRCEVTRAADAMTVRLPGDIFLPELSVTLPIADMSPDFPKVGHLLPKPEDATPGGQVAFNPRYLSTFCAIAKGRNTEVRMVPGASDKPQLVLIGDSYRALIMPVRNQQSPDPNWVTPDSGREKAKATSAPKASGEAA
jgi:hypothetical protein